MAGLRPPVDQHREPRGPRGQHHPCGRFRGDVVEYKVDNGHRVHDPEPYLNNRWTGRAVAAGLAGE